MIIYHQAYDANHCVFRMLSVFAAFPERTFQLDELRILDFFILFPSEIRNARIPAASKSLAPNLRATRYNSVPNRLRIFYQLHPIQNAALDHLVKAGFVSQETKEGVEGYLRTPKAIPAEVKRRIETSRALEQTKPIMAGYLLRLPLTGKDGLKGRSRLYNVRYDAT